MIKHDEMTFTFQSIFANIFYTPYWFLYADAEEERKTLDCELLHIIYNTYISISFLDIITGNNSTNLGAEAVATHMLLAFHMLFFNILLLNLLIAVFAYVH